MPPMVSVITVTSGFRRCSSIASANSTPTMTTGMVPITTRRTMRAAGSVFERERAAGSARVMRSRSSQK